MAVETADYCRSIEAYLCRKNDGHLIRIVGPAFEQVCSWADQGVPLKVAYRGIDRCFERYYAKGQRRRPVRVEFCEADVLDVFDEWRKAVGVLVARETADGAEDTPAEDAGARHRSLKSHLQRTMTRLSSVQAEGSLAAAVEAVRRLCEELLANAALRGEARSQALDRLRASDVELVAAARLQCDAPTMESLVAEAEEELSPFRGRMPSAAYEQAMQAAVSRLVRERFRLPVLSYD